MGGLLAYWLDEEEAGDQLICGVGRWLTNGWLVGYFLGDWVRVWAGRVRRDFVSLAVSVVEKWPVA